MFAFLDWRSLARAGCVCRGWARAARVDSLWFALLPAAVAAAVAGQNDRDDGDAATGALEDGGVWESDGGGDGSGGGGGGGGSGGGGGGGGGGGSASGWDGTGGAYWGMRARVAFVKEVREDTARNRQLRTTAFDAQRKAQNGIRLFARGGR